MNDDCFIKLEHRFTYNNGIKYADVAYLHRNNLVGIFEIYHTHKTREEDRPEPWYEFDASTVLRLVNKFLVLDDGYVRIV